MSKCDTVITIVPAKDYTYCEGETVWELNGVKYCAYHDPHRSHLE